jgi:CRISPR-associated protein Csm2
MEKLVSFYSNAEKKIPKDDLFDITAEKTAISFVNKNTKGDYYSVSGSQMRRIYDEVKRFDQKLDGDPGKWEKYYPYIKMIKSKISYNVARAIEKNKYEADVYNNLRQFILDGLDQDHVKDEKDYHVFAALFEAVYGFYYKETIDKNIRGRN